MIVNSLDPAAQAQLQAQSRLLLDALPATPLPAQAVPAAAVVPSLQVPVNVTADPVAILLQNGFADSPEAPIPTADIARRYAESGTLTQRAGSENLLPKDVQTHLGAADTKLLNSLAQAYRQPATATPLPPTPTTQRELANAQLPNAPSTGGNTPAVIIVDGKSLALNPAQTTLLRSALASGGAPDTKLLTSVFPPPGQSFDPDAVPLPQPASALRELAAAAIAQPAASERAQINGPQVPPRQTPAQPLPLPAANQPNIQGNPQTALAAAREQIAALPNAVIASAPALPAAATISNALTAVANSTLTTANSALATSTAAAPAATAAATIAAALPDVAIAPAAIVIDGRTFPLNPAQLALVRANFESTFRKAGPGVGGSDGEDPTIRAADANLDEVIRTADRVKSVEASPRSPVDSERQARPSPDREQGLFAALATDEKVEAVRAIRHDHPAPYEPQVIVPRPQDLAIIVPGHDRVILAGHEQGAAGEHQQAAITGIAIAVAAGITRDDVTAELHQDGYRLTFAGSSDFIQIQASAGLSAQLMFADGTSMRLQLSHD